MGGTNREDPEAPAMISIPQVHLSRATETHMYVVFPRTQTPLSCLVNFALPIGMLFGSLQWTLLSTERISQTDVPPHGIPRQMFLHMGSQGMMTHPS